jgi:hypothetical protein
VVYEDYNSQNRNNKSPVWFRFREDAGTLAGLPVSQQAYFYFASMVGLPRNLLCLIRPNLAADMQVRNYWEKHYGSVNLIANLGSTTSELAFDARPKPEVDSSIPFVSFSPANGAVASDACIYSKTTRTNFEFSTKPLPVWQVHFMRLFAEMTTRYNCQLTMLHIPDLADVRSSRIDELAFWPEIFGTNLVMLGVPPAKMFGSLSDEDIHKLYFNPGHLNKNGQVYFTSLILPSLMQIYETAVQP